LHQRPQSRERTILDARKAACHVPVVGPVITGPGNPMGPGGPLGQGEGGAGIGPVTGEEPQKLRDVTASLGSEHWKHSGTLRSLPALGGYFLGRSLYPPEHGRGLTTGSSSAGIVRYSPICTRHATGALDKFTCQACRSQNPVPDGPAPSTPRRGFFWPRIGRGPGRRTDLRAHPSEALEPMRDTDGRSDGAQSAR
jgi:hypothetical protein